jgi:hypothetical protein
METHRHTKQLQQNPSLCFRTQFTENEAVQAQPHSKLKNPNKPCCNAPDTCCNEEFPDPQQPLQDFK